jgi:hypothetical protein
MRFYAPYVDGSMRYASASQTCLAWASACSHKTRRDPNQGACASECLSDSGNGPCRCRRTVLARRYYRCDNMASS